MAMNPALRDAVEAARREVEPDVKAGGNVNVFRNSQAVGELFIQQQNDALNYMSRVMATQRADNDALRKMLAESEGARGDAKFVDAALRDLILSMETQLEHERAEKKRWCDAYWELEALYMEFDDANESEAPVAASSAIPPLPKPAASAVVESNVRVSAVRGCIGQCGEKVHNVAGTQYLCIRCNPASKRKRKYTRRI